MNEDQEMYRAIYKNGNMYTVYDVQTGHSGTADSIVTANKKVDKAVERDPSPAKETTGGDSSLGYNVIMDTGVIPEGIVEPGPIGAQVHSAGMWPQGENIQANNMTQGEGPQEPTAPAAPQWPSSNGQP